ncbi:MAG: glycosyltransferase, partial [Planctomycetaceae bacterium]
MDKIMLAVLFWSSTWLVVYIYLGYPALVWTLAKRRRPAEVQCLERPLSVVIVAYNEAARLPRKIDSILAADGSAAVREIVVASDGSTDATCDLVQNHSDPRVRLRHFDQRRGKPAVLNDTIPACASDVVVLTDALQELDPGALQALMAKLSDPEV